MDAVDLKLFFKNLISIKSREVICHFFASSYLQSYCDVSQI